MREVWAHWQVCPWDITNSQIFRTRQWSLLSIQYMHEKVTESYSMMWLIHKQPDIKMNLIVAERWMPATMWNVFRPSRLIKPILQFLFLTSLKCHVTESQVWQSGEYLVMTIMAFQRSPVLATAFCQTKPTVFSLILPPYKIFPIFKVCWKCRQWI